MDLSASLAAAAAQREKKAAEAQAREAAEASKKADFSAAFGAVAEPTVVEGDSEYNVGTHRGNVKLWKQGFRQGISGGAAVKGGFALPGMHDDVIADAPAAKQMSPSTSFGEFKDVAPPPRATPPVGENTNGAAFAPKPPSAAFPAPKPPQLAAAFPAPREPQVSGAFPPPREPRLRDSFPAPPKEPQLRADFAPPSSSTKGAFPPPNPFPPANPFAQPQQQQPSSSTAFPAPPTTAPKPPLPSPSPPPKAGLSSDAEINGLVDLQNMFVTRKEEPHASTKPPARSLNDIAKLQGDQPKPPAFAPPPLPESHAYEQQQYYAQQHYAQYAQHQQYAQGYYGHVPMMHPPQPAGTYPPNAAYAGMPPPHHMHR